MLGAFLRDVCRRYPCRVTANVGLLIAANLAGVLSVAAVAPIVDLCAGASPGATSTLTRRIEDVFRGLGLPFGLGPVLVVFLGLQAARSVIAILAERSVAHAKYALVRDLMVGTFTDVFRSRWSFFWGGDRGALLNTLVREVTVVGDGFRAIGFLLASLIQFLLFLLVPLVLSWEVTLISVLAAFVFALPLLSLGRAAYACGRRSTTTANEVVRLVQESLGAAKQILGAGKREEAIESVSRAFEAHEAAAVRAQTLQSLPSLAYDPIGWGIVILALLSARRMGLSIADTGVLLWALRCAIPSVGRLAEQRTLLARVAPSWEQVCHLRRLAREMTESCGTIPFPGLMKEVVFEDIHVEHDGRRPALRGVTLSVRKGETVAILGESGSGKTTVADLLLGLIEPQRGRILVDGVPLSHYDLDSYRKRVAYATQEVVLFDSTLRENLRWSKQDATDEELEEACRLACLDEFLGGCREGYDTVVGERGVRLSGGERQRIALARAIVRNPDLLVLDEVTSSLDAESEQRVQEAVERISGRTTVVVLGHHLAPTTRADRVIRLHEGQVVEEMCVS